MVIQEDAILHSEDVSIQPCLTRHGGGQNIGNSIQYQGRQQRHNLQSQKLWSHINTALRESQLHYIIKGFSHFLVTECLWHLHDVIKGKVMCSHLWDNSHNSTWLSSVFQSLRKMSIITTHLQYQWVLTTCCCSCVKICQTVEVKYWNCLSVTQAGGHPEEVSLNSPLFVL